MIFFYLKANQLYLLVLIESRLFKVSLAEVLAAFNDLLLAAVPESAGLTVAPVVVLSAERLSVVLPEALVLLLQAVARHYDLTQNTSDLDLISIYLNFIRFCQHTDGSFLNYVDEQKQFTNQNYETNLEDANGRAMWALGYLISLKAVLPPEWSETAEEIIRNNLAWAEKIHSPRAMAFIIKGLYYQNAEQNLPLLTKLANRLATLYRQ